MRPHSGALLGSLKKNTVFLLVTVGLFSLLLVPFVAFAEAPTNLQGVLGVFGKLVQIITPVIFALALLAFFWGLAMYLFSFGGEEKDKKKGRAIMLYGVLVLFVAFSIWGIVNLLSNTFIGGSKTAPPVPFVPNLGQPANVGQ